MRLVFVRMTPAWDGQARVFAHVARALGERGHECWLMAPAGSEVAIQAVERGVKVLALPQGKGAWRTSRVMRSLLPADFADAVFVHDDAEHLAAALAVRSAGRGIVVRRVGAGESLALGWRGTRAEQLAATRYLYTTDSPPSSLAAKSGTLPGVRAELGVVIPPLIVGGLDARGGEVTALACVATRRSLRRATNVVRAAAMLAQRHQALRLRVIGSVAYEQDLKLLAAALGIGRRVDWLGFTDDASVYTGVAAGWVVADGDDAALGVLELMAHGIPVLAERTGIGARYVSHGIHGALMATLDPALMAAETATMLADADTRMAMGAAARLRIEREFSHREMLAGFELAARGARDRAGDRGGARTGARA